MCTLPQLFKDGCCAAAGDLSGTVILACVVSPSLHVSHPLLPMLLLVLGVGNSSNDRM
jgi:hypothetical protein